MTDSAAPPLLHDAVEPTHSRVGKRWHLPGQTELPKLLSHRREPDLIAHLERCPVNLYIIRRCARLCPNVCGEWAVWFYRLRTRAKTVAEREKEVQDRCARSRVSHAGFCTPQPQLGVMDVTKPFQDRHCGQDLRRAQPIPVSGVPTQGEATCVCRWTRTKVVDGGTHVALSKCPIARIL